MSCASNSSSSSESGDSFDMVVFFDGPRKPPSGSDARAPGYHRSTRGNFKFITTFFAPRRTTTKTPPPLLLLLPNMKLSDEAYTTVILHAAKHPASSVTGLLVGDSTQSVERVVPLVHNWTDLAPMTEVASSLVSPQIYTRALAFM